MAGFLDWRTCVLTLLSFLSFVQFSFADLAEEYCSNQNNGAANFQSTYSFNSNGYCSDKCRANFAFAIVQGQNCWCSNYVPSNQQSTGSCGEKCPGYPYENCGSVDGNLFGYVGLDKSPSGTAGSGQNSAAKSGASFSTKTMSIVEDLTITQEEVSPTNPPSSPSPTKSQPITSVQVVTISGSVITQTVTSMPKSGADKLEQKQKLSSGAIAATVVASIIAAVAVVVGVMFLLIWRRRRMDPEFRHEVTSPSTSPFSNPRGSVHSKIGLLGARSSVNAIDTFDTQSPMEEQRQNRLRVYDQRLNPRAFMHHSDGSYTSVYTMQDNRDYTRTLNVVNPDPPE